MKWLRSVIVPGLIGITVSYIYITHASRSVYGGDVGDLVTSAVVGGVPHPPGYPLFTLLGWLITRLPWMDSPAFMVGLIAACAGSLGIVAYYALILRFVRHAGIAIIASLTLAFTYLYWFYAEIAEVFSLHGALVILILLFAVLWRQTQQMRYWYGVCFAFGLSVANHHTIILLVPSLIILMYQHVDVKKTWRMLFRRALLCGVALVAGASSYLYVPIASSFQPVINWGNVVDIPSFLRLFFRMDYGTFQAGHFPPVSIEQRIILVQHYLFSLVTQMTIPVAVVSAVGIIKGLFRYPRITWALLTGWLLSGPLFLGYSGFPVTNQFIAGVYERFFLMSLIIISPFFAYGLSALIVLLRRVSPRTVTEYACVMIWMLIPIQLFLYNSPKTNLSQVWIGDHLAEDFLNPLPKDSIFITGGDTGLFNTWYVRYARGIRPDVSVVSMNGMLHERLFDETRAAIRAQKPELTQEENITEALRRLSNSRMVFATSQLQPATGSSRFTWVPYGLTFQLLPEGENGPTRAEFDQSTSDIWSRLRVPYPTGDAVHGSLTISELPSLYAQAMLVTGTYYLTAYNDPQTAYQWFTRATEVAPDWFDKPYQVLGSYHLTVTKTCDQAAFHLNRAKTLNPYDPYTYLLLYATYQQCLSDSESAAEVAGAFERIFYRSLNDALKEEIQSP